MAYAHVARFRERHDGVNDHVIRYLPRDWKLFAQP